MSRRKVSLFVLGVGLYLLTTGISAWVFGAFTPAIGEGLVTPVPRTQEGELVIDPSKPKDQPCPINGKMFTKTEQAVWEQRRPLYVMIENHPDSQPQSGLVEADVVYEAVAEGGITRFGAVYYCDVVAADTVLAPVRSARTYFLDWASEYHQPLYVHVGGANCSRDQATGECTSDPRVQSLEQIEKYGWGGRNGNDLNQFSIGYPVFWRNYERLGRTVATEHTMETTSERLWEVGEQRGWTATSPEGDDWSKGFKPWKFTDPPTDSSSSPPATNISFGFWDSYTDFDVRWEYEPTTGLYRRVMGGKPHLDQKTGEPIKAKVVIVQFADETGPLDQHKHMLYNTKGPGKAIVFHSGQAIKATWRKPDRTARTVFSDEKGRELALVRGQIWIEVVPAGNSVEY